MRCLWWTRYHLNNVAQSHREEECSWVRSIRAIESAGNPSINDLRTPGFPLCISRDAFTNYIYAKYNLDLDMWPCSVVYAEGSNCKLEAGNIGVCTKIHECPPRLREVIDGQRDAGSTGRCGFKKDTEIVCCQSYTTGRIGPAEIDTVSLWPEQWFTLSGW